MVFGEVVSEGLWSKMLLLFLFMVVIVVVVLFGIVMLMICFIVWWLGFNCEDEIIILFCGFKKSLVIGVLIVKVLFVGGSFGVIVLLIMIYY